MLVNGMSRAPVSQASVSEQYLRRRCVSLLLHLSFSNMFCNAVPVVQFWLQFSVKVALGAHSIPLTCASQGAGESFRQWSAPRLRMSASGSKDLKRRSSPPRKSAPGEKDSRRHEQVRARLVAERRTKFQQDRPAPSNYKGKGKVADHPSNPKKRKVGHPTQSESSPHEDDDEDHDWR